MIKFKQFLVPAVIILMGAGAAFATNAAKAGDSDPVSGYYFDSSSGQCIEAKNSSCLTSGTSVCTWTDDVGASHVLSSQINTTTCGQVLYRP